MILKNDITPCSFNTISHINITKNIFYYRTLNGLSQNDLALYLNISREAISKWERGICLPDIENMIMLTEIYRISLDNFVFSDNI